MSATTFEDEVREMLARRAADIPSPVDGAVPPLPTGLRIPIDAAPPSARRVRWLAVAAAVVLLLGGAGLVVRNGGGDRERTGPADVPTRPTGPTPPIEGLPEGLTSADLLPLWTDAERVTKVDAASSLSNAPLAFGRYLRDRFPAVGVGSTGRFDEVDGFPDWHRATFTRRLSNEGGGTSQEAEAYLWWSGEAWSVMAVLSRVVVLTPLAVDRRRMEGSVHGDGDRRALAVGPRVPDLRLDRWQDDLAIVGESPGGDVSIDVSGQSLAPFDGPVTLLVAPFAVTSDPPSDYSELAFDPTELPDPGPNPPTTPPTIGGGGIPMPGTEPVGIPVDVPVARAVEALLPAGEELVAAEHRTSPDGRMDEVSFSSVVDQAGYTVRLFRVFDAGEYESMPGEVPISWGRAWIGGSQGRMGVTVESLSGIALSISQVDPDGPLASHDELLARAEALAGDPTVAAVANGADPAG